MDFSLKKWITIGKPKSHHTKLHLAILQHYVEFLQTMSEQELPTILITDSPRPKEISELQRHVFRVPKLKKLPHGINKHRQVKEFTSFLVRFLYHEPRSVTDSSRDQIRNLEKGLRFLLTVLGDTLLTDVDEQESENLLAEFEAVANEAGGVVLSLFFVPSDGGSDVVLNHINLLTANIMRLSHVGPNCVSRSTHDSQKTSVVESLLVLDLLVRDVEDLMNGDDGRIADVKDQIQTLHQGLLCFQPFIKDAGGSSHDQLKEYYMRIGHLAHQAQHLIVSFLAGDAPPWYLINRLIHVNHKIELCRVELPEITMKCTFGGLEVADYLNRQMSSSLPKINTAANEDVVGLEDKMTYIMDHLVGGAAELRVISIFGMPGLGKTTLAKKLYNHPYVNYRFDRLSWCVVSQTYLKRNVLANILVHIASELNKDMILEMEEDRLAEHIHKTLKGRRYLIVMDDVWDPNVRDEMVRCFPDDGNGSRILFTTRNKDVVPPNSIMYALPSLSDDQCWELLQKKVFGNQHCPAKLVKSGLELAASCHGMPLSAVVIAGILSKVDKDERSWEEVRRNLSSYMLDGGDNSVMEILKLSYDHLPQHLKLCFLYAGVYFEEQEIPTRSMKNMWISEGFIHGKNENNAAEEYLNELIGRSLVMVGKRRSDGGPGTCVIHDLLRELCLKTCKEEKLMRFVNNKYLENEEDGLKVDTNSTTWMCSQYMRNRFGPHQRRAHRYQVEVPDMRLLRVLHFDCSFIYLSGIEYLVCLKYLVVPDLPPSISNLVNLEYLCVDSRKWVILSSSVMKMKKLKYVDSSNGIEYERNCNTSITNKLEFLSRVYIGNVHDEDMLKCSPHIRELKCFYIKRVVTDLSFLSQLETVHITFLIGYPWVVRLSLSLPSSIKNLSLAGYRDKLHPQTMSLIGRLENLEVLRLESLQFEGKSWDTRDGEFQKLKHLTLYRMTNLRRWNVGSSQHFPQLQHLEVYLCYPLLQIPAEIGEIPTLQTIKVDGSQEGSARRIQQEQRDMGNDDLRVLISSDINWYHLLDFGPLGPSLKYNYYNHFPVGGRHTK